MKQTFAVVSSWYTNGKQTAVTAGKFVFATDMSFTYNFVTFEERTHSKRKRKNKRSYHNSRLAGG